MAEDIKALQERVRLMRAVKEKRAAAADALPAENIGGRAMGAAKSALGAYTSAMAAPQKLMSSAIAAGLEKVTGKPANGNTPTQVFKSAGMQIPRGNPLLPPGTANIPGTMSGVTAGDVADLAVDTATDPMTYIGGAVSKFSKIPKYANWGEKALPVLGKVSPLRTAQAVVNPIEKFSDLISDGAYSLASGKLNPWAQKEGLPIMPGRTMRDGNFSGGIHDQAQFFDDMRVAAGQDMNRVKAEATKRGLGANIKSDILPVLELEAREFDKIPHEAYQKMAENLRSKGQYLHDFYPDGSMPFAEVNETKSAVTRRQDYSGKGQFANQADADNAAVEKKLAEGLLSGEEIALQRNAPDLAEEFSDAKRRYSSTSGELADKAHQIASEVPNQRSSLMPTVIDVGLLGAAATGNHTALGALAAKKAFETARTPGAQAILGYGADKLYKSANRGVLDRIVQRMANPWASEEEPKR